MGREEKKVLVYIKRTLAILLVIALFLGGVQTLNRVLHGYTSDWYHPELYPKNSVDVAFVGSSHVYDSIIPQLLMDEYGIASANLVSAGLLGTNTIELVEMILHHQRPQVMVLDLFGFLAPYLYEKDMRGDAYEHKEAVDYITRQRHVGTVPVWGLEKYPWIIKGAMEDPNILTYSSLIYLQHENALTSDWRNLTGKMLRANQIDFGHEFNFEKNYRLGVDYTPEELEEAHVYEPYWDHLEAILALAEKEELEIIFTFFPYKTNNAERKLMEEIEDFMNERGAHFVSMTEVLDGALLDEYEDYLNRGHTNYYGATKLTWFWGDYLYMNYDLPDRSEDDDPRYDQWKQRPYSYLGDEAVGILPKEGDYETYVENLSQANEKYITVLTINGSEEFADVDSCITPLVDYLELDSDRIAQENTVTTVVLQGNEILCHKVSRGFTITNMYLDDCGYQIRVTPGGSTSVYINDQLVCHGGKNGVMFFITNSLREEEVDKAVFTFEEEYPIRQDFEYEEEE